MMVLFSVHGLICMNVHVSLLLLLSNCVAYVIIIIVEAYSSLCSSFTCIHVFIL